MFNVSSAKLLVILLLIGMITSLARAEDCGFVPSESQLKAYQERVLQIFGNQKGAYQSTALSGPTYHIGITFHVVRYTDGSGGVTVAEVDDALGDLNARFEQVGFLFIRTGPVDFIDNDNYADYSTSVCGVNLIPGTVNVYVIPGIPQGYCGFQSGPCVSVKTGCLPHFSVTAHEVGHYFDLLHTHYGYGCPGSDCSTTGDFLCDTPADPNLSGRIGPACEWDGVAQVAWCEETEWTTDLHNIMSYSYLTCRDTFSPMQIAIMRSYLLSNLSNHIIPKSVYVDAVNGNDNNDGTESSPVATISRGLELAGGGDQVLVDPGTYSGPLVITAPNVSLVSTGGPEVTTITGASNVDLLTIGAGTTSGALIQGFTFAGGNRAIWCQNSSPTIRFNVFKNQSTSNRGAILLSGAADAESGNAPAVLSFNTITDCVNAGIYDISTVAPVIKNNVIVYCSYGVIKLWELPDPVLSYNDVWECNTLYFNIANMGSNNISKNPKLAPNLMPLPYSPCIDAANPADGGNNPYASHNNIGGIGDVYAPAGLCSPAAWEKTFGGTLSDKANSVAQTIDGGFVIVGTSASNATPGKNTAIYLVKLDNCGNLQFDRVFEPASDNEGFDVEQTQDAGFVIVGTAYYNTTDRRDGIIIKTDSLGQTQWTNRFGGFGDDVLRSVKQSSDRGFITVGHLQVSAYSAEDPMMVKFDKNGNQSWTETFDGISRAYLKDVIQGEDKNYYACGFGHQWLGNEEDFYSDGIVVKASPSGNRQWTRLCGVANSWDSLMTIAEIPGQGVVVGGFSNYMGTYNSDALVRKLDFNGNVIWTRLYGGLGGDDLAGIAYSPSGRLIIGGSSNSYSLAANKDIWTYLINDSGDMLWMKGFRTSGEDRGTSIVPTYDGGYAVAGWTNHSGAGGFDFKLIKYDDSANAPILLSPADRATVANLTPTLSWNAVSGVGMYRVEVTNLAAGNLYFDSPLRSASTSQTNWTVAPTLAAGTYYWRVKSSFLGGHSYSSQVRELVVTSPPPPPPPPSCPVLFVSNGNEFVQLNPLLTACEASGYVNDVTDYYHVNAMGLPQGGTVNFQLRELEDEITYLKDIELLAVDHPKETRVICSTDGKINLVKSESVPQTAIDQDGVDRLAEISHQDGSWFSSSSAGSLVLEFVKPRDGETGVAFGSSPKPPCEPGIDRASVGGANTALRIEVLSGDGEWVTYRDLPSRTDAKAEVVMFDELTESVDEVLTVRLTWEGSYQTDLIELVCASDIPPSVKEVRPDGMTVFSDGVEPVLLRSGFDHPLTLRKGDVFDFSFECGEIGQGLERDYIIKAFGRYEPDYSVYSHLLPTEFELYDNYPNPFNPQTRIAFDMPRQGRVKLVIYNSLGELVATLIDDVRPAGHQEVTWNGTNSAGAQVATGVYFYKLSINDFSKTKKMLLLK